MLWPAATVLITAFLIQNLAELRGGGPSPPAFILRQNRAAADRIRHRAVAAAGLLVPVLLIAGVGAGWSWLVLMVAGALAANALVQLVQSIRAGRMLPGTRSGLLLMLPAAIWLSAMTGRMPEALGWMLLGTALSIPVLFVIWYCASLAEGR